MELLADHVVCREGETLSANQAAVLRVFDVKMAAFRMRLIACWQFDGKPKCLPGAVTVISSAPACARDITSCPANSGLLLRQDTLLVLQAALWRGERASSQESYRINTCACAWHGEPSTRIMVPACLIWELFGAAGGVVEELNEPELQLEGEGQEADDAAVIGLEE